MRLLIAVTSFWLALGAYPAASQHDFAVASIENVRQFVHFEIAGGRITDEGWRTANQRFFLDSRGFAPEPPPKERNILVVSDKFHVRLESFSRDTEAVIEASFDVCYGGVDSRLRFVYPGGGVPWGVAVKVVCASEFDLRASRIVKTHIGPTPDTIILS